MKFQQTVLALAGLCLFNFAHADSVSSNIPLVVNIPKQCSINNPNDQLVIPTDGTASTANYSVTCNTGYSIWTGTDNYSTSDWATHVTNGTSSLKTFLGTTGPRGTNIIIQGVNSYPGSSVDNFTLSASLANPVSATQTAGNYTDTYHIVVSY